jgi:hypothetical protein
VSMFCCPILLIANVMCNQKCFYFKLHWLELWLIQTKHQPTIATQQVNKEVNIELSTFELHPELLVHNRILHKRLGRGSTGWALSQ